MGLILLIIIIVIVAIFALTLVRGIDYMKDKHPDYKGEDFFIDEVINPKDDKKS